MSKRIVISDESVNCYGTWVKTDGADISQFEKNPVLLWMHWRGIIIGCIKDVKKEDGKITGEPYFDEVRDESKLAKQQWEKGTLRMASAHFEVLETSDAPELLKPGQYRAACTRTKLVETSMVDIGGNDNALPLMLSYQGKELKLAAGEECDFLPLINNKPQKEENQMNELKTIALKLGLPETASEADVLGKIGVLLGLQAEHTQLQEEVRNLRLSGITSAVDEAIGKRLILAEKRAHFIEVGEKTGLESLKLTFAAMTPVQKPLDILHPTGGASGSMQLGNWQKLSEVPADKIAELKETDMPTYMKLFKAEYGYDMPK